MKRSYVPRSFGTHDGSFHADEVTACALLCLLNLIDEDKIIRTRDQLRLDGCEYICDVGGCYDPEEKLFDHHQVDYQGGMASAGMVLKYLLNERLLTPKEYDYFNEAFVRGVDAHDNGQDPQLPGICTFSHVISNYNPISRESSDEALDIAFKEALHFTRGHLKRLRERLHYSEDCLDMVAKAMTNFDDCLVFDRNIAWMESFFELGGESHSASFIIMPAGQHWKLRGIPPNLHEKMKVRVPLPKEWAGLLDEDLKKASGIAGAIFCHKGRFVSVWKSKEDALHALKCVLKNEQDSSS